MNKAKLSVFSALCVTFMFGIMAGFFWTYSFNVNYATMSLGANDYAKVQSLFNVNVRHALFFVFFFGCAVFSLLAVALSWWSGNRLRAGLLLTAGLLYFFGVVVFTQQVNLPLNYQTESWQQGAVPDNWHAVRAAWNQANLFRTAVSAFAFFLGLWSLTVNPANRGQ